MSEKEQPPIMDQKLCINGCGFFGSSRFSHMCSKCFKDKMSQSMRESEGSKDGGSSSASLAPNPNAMEEDEGVVEAGVQGVGAGAGTGVSVASASAPAPVAAGSPAIAAATGVPTMMPVGSSAVAVAAPSGVSAGASGAVVASEGVGAGSAAGAAHTSAPVVIQPQPMETSHVPQQKAEASPRVPEPVAPPEPAAASLGAGASSAGRSASGAASVAAVGEAAAAAAAVPSTRPEQKNRKRCFACHKKVGYTGIACRCNYVFCSLHRYPEQHDCTFDFKTSDRNELKRTVVGGGQFSKLDRL